MKEHTMNYGQQNSIFSNYNEKTDLTKKEAVVMNAEGSINTPQKSIVFCRPLPKPRPYSDIRDISDIRW